MHVLPRVRELHERFADTLVVIGVHSGKFVTERRTDRIAMACRRLGLHHPVVNDRQYRIWRDYGVSAWPTVALIDPEGYLVGVQPGEFDVDGIAKVIEDVIAEATSRGTLVRGEVPEVAGAIAPEPPEARSGLTFPVRAIVAGGRLWVSELGHHHVLECAWDARSNAATVLHEHTGFVEPRGLAADGAGGVYVADRAAHSVWRIEPEIPGSPILTEDRRKRIAGTGAMADYRLEEGSALAPLRSPWGVAVRGGRLLVAMAGSHQLWWIDLAAGRMALAAGGGREDIDDGPAYRALLAQPTGIAAMGVASAGAGTGAAAAEVAGAVPFADCETSAVRLFEAEDRVRTIVGTGLFKFGDRAGVGDEALLQHCEDVASVGDVVCVADTYNDRLKLVNPVTRECESWPGEAGEGGTFAEPSGVSALADGLLVADTNNHRLVVVGQDRSLTEVTLA